MEMIVKAVTIGSILNRKYVKIKKNEYHRGMRKDVIRVEEDNSVT